MQKRSSKKKKEEDINKLAALIIEQATEEEKESEEVESEEESTDVHKNPHAQALGRLGGLKGGKARATKLSAKRRKEIARLAAQARWKKSE